MSNKILSKKILHICVNYKNNVETLDFATSLQKQKLFKDSVSLIIANNSAQSAEDRSLQSPTAILASNTQIYNLPENPGYFGAAQKVWTHTQSQNLDFEWVILSNTDLYLRTEDFYERLLQFPISQFPQTGLLAPSIISGISKRETNPFMKTRPSSARMLFYRIFFSYYLTCQIYQFLGFLKAKVKNRIQKNKTHEINPSQGLTESIYAPHGAFMVFHRNFFSSGLDFSHPCFLYGEEISTAEKCQKNNLKIYFYPHLKVFHAEHGSEGIQSYLFKYNTFRFKKDSSRAIYDTYFK